MQTHFTSEQLEDPAIRDAEKILRSCVHCGLCTASCPTYTLLGDELDSPRGRIYLIKDMLENDRAATPAVVKHIDRCLSCLACMPACPSGVHYQHLVDHAREHIENTYRRPFADRWLRALLAAVLPYERRLRAALAMARLVRPFAPMLPARLRALLALLPARSSQDGAPPVAAALGQAVAHQADFKLPARMRVLLMEGCVQTTLAPSITAAARRVLQRLGADVVLLPGCCGALNHHLGKSATARDFARARIAAVRAELARGPVDALVVTASGCGTQFKDYGHLLREDPEWAADAARVAALSRDISEVIAALGFKPPAQPAKLRVAYQAACSLQHGQGITDGPRTLLTAAGFELCDIADAHLCYNLLQPEIAGALRERKLAAIAAAKADVLASGNIGCMTQLATAAGGRVLHTVELLDWATGGPCPPALAGLTQSSVE
jgi:glycolate oxidase iron-sulfur subunit